MRLHYITQAFIARGLHNADENRNSGETKKHFILRVASQDKPRTILWKLVL